MGATTLSSYRRVAPRLTLAELRLGFLLQSSGIRGTELPDKRLVIPRDLDLDPSRPYMRGDRRLAKRLGRFAFALMARARFRLFSKIDETDDGPISRLQSLACALLLKGLLCEQGNCEVI